MKRLAFAFLLAGCSNAAAPDLSLVVRSIPLVSTSQVGKDIVIRSTIINAASEPAEVWIAHCTTLFEVLQEDRVVAPSTQMICTAIANPPVFLAAGDSQVVNTTWRPTNLDGHVLPAGSYQIRARVHAGTKNGSKIFRGEKYELTFQDRP